MLKKITVLYKLFVHLNKIIKYPTRVSAHTLHSEEMFSECGLEDILYIIWTQHTTIKQLPSTLKARTFLEQKSQSLNFEMLFTNP